MLGEGTIFILGVTAGAIVGWVLRKILATIRDRRRKEQDAPVSPYKSTIKGVTIPLKKK